MRRGRQWGVWRGKAPPQAGVGWGQQKSTKTYAPTRKQLPTPAHLPGPTHAGTTYPVQGNPHFDIFFPAKCFSIWGSYLSFKN